MFLFSAAVTCSAQQTVLYQDNFDKPLDTLSWKVEMLPGENAKVNTENQKLVIDAPYGVTFWFKHKLTVPVRIEYDWKVVVADGINDRLSDLNQFWMATDPKNKDLFTRNGKFSDYDSLSLYYVGMEAIKIPQPDSGNIREMAKGNYYRNILIDHICSNLTINTTSQ